MHAATGQVVKFSYLKQNQYVNILMLSFDRVQFYLASYPGPLRGRRKDLIPIAHTCANYPMKTWGATNNCMLFHPPAAA